MTRARLYTSVMAGGHRRGGIRSLGGLGEGGGIGSSEPPLPLRRDVIEQIKAEIDYVETRTGFRVDPEGKKALLDQSAAAFEKVESEGEDATLTTGELSGFEAVIKTDGSRPVLFVVDGFVDFNQPSLTGYAEKLSFMRGGIEGIAAAVGRVDDPSHEAKPLGYQGTCFMVGPDIVMTNRHVLHAIARKTNLGEVLRDLATGLPVLKDGIFIDFAQEVGTVRTDRQFPVRRVLYEGTQGAEHYLSGQLNFDTLDMALLQLTAVPNRKWPSPIVFERKSDPTRGALTAAGHGVYLIGFPGNELSTTPDLFSKLFGGVKGFKRLAPGEIMAGPGALPPEQDPHQWILSHDASTLGGNSGSAVVDFALNGATVLGLHFAGYHARQNWGHAFVSMGGLVDDALGASASPTSSPGGLGNRDAGR